MIHLALVVVAALVIWLVGSLVLGLALGRVLRTARRRYEALYDPAAQIEEE